MLVWGVFAKEPAKRFFVDGPGEKGRPGKGPAESKESQQDDDEYGKGPPSKAAGSQEEGKGSKEMPGKESSETGGGSVENIVDRIIELLHKLKKGTGK